MNITPNETLDQLIYRTSSPEERKQLDEELTYYLFTISTWATRFIESLQ